MLKIELTAAGSPHNLKVYPGAKHAFFNDQLRLPPGDPDRGEPAPDRAVGKRTWEEFLARPHPAHQLATAMKRQTGISVSHRDLRLR